MLSRRQSNEMRKRTTDRLCSIAVILAVGLVITLTIVLPPNSLDVRRRLPDDDSDSDDFKPSEDDLKMLKANEEGKDLMREWQEIPPLPANLENVIEHHMTTLDALITNIRTKHKAFSKKFDQLKRSIAKKKRGLDYTVREKTKLKTIQEINDLKKDKSKVFQNSLPYDRALGELLSQQKILNEQLGAKELNLFTKIKRLETNVRLFQDTHIDRFSFSTEAEEDKAIRKMNDVTIANIENFRKKEDLEVSLEDCLNRLKRAAREKKRRLPRYKGPMLNLDSIHNEATRRIFESGDIPTEPRREPALHSVSEDDESSSPDGEAPPKPTFG